MLHFYVHMEISNTTFETLNRLGFSQSQSKLYLELLVIGQANVAQMAKALHTSRQAIYLLLPELIDRGLIKEIYPAKRTLYQALPPSQLYTLVEDLKHRLDTVIPSLTNIQNIPEDVPLVTIYDSPLSMRDWYRHFLAEVEKDEKFYLYSSENLEAWYDLDPKFYRNYMEQQVKKGLHLLCLLPLARKGDEHKQDVGWSVSEYRYTHHTLSTNMEIWIWRDEVCYLTIQGRQTNMIVIKSKNLAEFSKKQFLTVWETAVQ